MSKQKGGNKSIIAVVIVLLLLIVAGIGGWWWLGKSGLIATSDGQNPSPDQVQLSLLTGLELSAGQTPDAPTYCVQIPNGSTDGARPQVGLSSAGVVFEAIAESGITRFAAVYDANTDAGVIGPIRSLRPYYLDWDTPFDCTIVHDGGSDEALAAVANGRYRNLDEDFQYMWKEDYIQGQYRYWNNVFTSPEKLIAFNQSRGETTSNPKTFPRLTDAEVQEILSSQKALCDADAETECEVAESHVQITHITTKFTNLLDYIVNYDYDPATNTYLRSYETGAQHLAYSCPRGANDVESCSLVQVAPSAIAVMRVRENIMSDNYHENIQTIGGGEAIIFQNGTVTEGTWEKSSQASQIIFRDTAGSKISFTPGQLWIAAVPQYGSVSWTNDD